LELGQRIKLRASISYQHRLDNTNFTELSSSDDESKSEDIEDKYLMKGLYQENEAQEDASANLNYNLDVDIDEYLFTQTHPALDIEAKWNICKIFIDNLDAPFDV
ncbi:3724_t:CDS:2, partial [Gigaspora margarita]